MINRQAPVVVETTIDIEAPPEAVWRVLANVARWPDWYPHIRAAAIDGDLAPGATIAWEPGGQEVRSLLTAVEPARRLEWEGRGGDMLGLHVWQISPHGDGTRVFNSESVEGGTVATNAAAIQEMLGDVISAWNRSLKRRVEGRV